MGEEAMGEMQTLEARAVAAERDLEEAEAERAGALRRREAEKERAGIRRAEEAEAEAEHLREKLLAIEAQM
eukprot:4621704-Pyramimonas_sp.AAC.1